MMNSDNTVSRITLGYDLDRWWLFGEKIPITIDISPGKNSHILLCGMSGSGKSFLESQILTKLALAEPNGEIYFADYKQDEAFSHLRNCPRYYPYRTTLQALEIVHDRLIARQSGEDTRWNPVTLLWDEYVAQMFSIVSENKKASTEVMGKVSEILMLGRSLGPIRLIISCQRPDAIVLPAAARLNVGYIVICGGAVRSIYEMLIPDFIDEVKGRRFGLGEGVAVFQNSELRFIKVGTVVNVQRMEKICIEALGGTQ